MIPVSTEIGRDLAQRGPPGNRVGSTLLGQFEAASRRTAGSPATATTPLPAIATTATVTNRANVLGHGRGFPSGRVPMMLV